MSSNVTKAILGAAVEHIEQKGRWSAKHSNDAQAIIVGELGPLAGQYRTRLSAHMRKLSLKNASRAALRDIGVL